MSAVVLLLLVALLIPLAGVVLDSPIGRALARRLDRSDEAPPPLTDLARKVELLEAELDDLARSVKTLEDENAFLQRLLGDPASRSTLPPSQP